MVKFLTTAKFRASIAATRACTRVLRRMGLREHVANAKASRTRRRRFEAEQRGDDSLSKPALHELDAKLARIIDRRGRFFVEAGANDGFEQSNTYWLERFHGWTGILIEPIPALAAEASRERCKATVVNCALVSADDPRETVAMRFGGLMSIVDGAKDASWPAWGTTLGWDDPYDVEVEARTLSSVLDEQAKPEIDLLSLDVEGYEPAVLGGLDLARHAPRYILVEIHERDSAGVRIADLLGGRYVEHSWLSPCDLLYVRSDVANSAL